MFICWNIVTYIETSSNYSELLNFITSWKMNRKAIKPCRRSFLHNINKTWVPCKCIYGDDITSFKFKTLKLHNLMKKIIKTPQNFVEFSLAIKLILMVRKFQQFERLNYWVPVFSSYRNQSIDLHNKSVDWFLYESNTSRLN